MNHSSIANATTSTVPAILLELAKQQEELAADEAAAVPYWTPCPPSVSGHRAAAEALREQAERFFTEPIRRAS